MSPRLVVILACIGLGACGRGDRPTLQASWAGKDTGQMAGTPTVAWCAGARRLELTLTRDDGGVGLVLYPRADLGVPDSFTGLVPESASQHRPGASAAARWFTEQTVAGFESDSGAVVTAGDSLRLDGRFGFRLRSVSQPETLRLTGRFHDLRPGACPLDSVPSPAADSVSSGPPGD